MRQFIHSPTHLAGIVVLVLFGVSYMLIGPANHLMFRTYALDLGAYTHASWCYGHGILPDRSLFRADSDPMLADHFDLMLMLWSQLTWIFGEWTLLLVQIAAVLLGAAGMWRLVRAITGDAVLAILAMTATLGFFGVFTALAFDYRSNVVAAMVLPWWLLALHQGHLGRSWLLLFLMLMAKENMGLWLFVVSLSAIALPYLPRKVTRPLMLQAAVSLCWSLIAIGILMPWSDTSGEYHLAGSFLPKNPIEAGILDLLLPFFHDVQGINPLGDRIKLEWYLVVVLSGGWALVRNWPYLIMSIPLVAQKMLHVDPSKWGLFAHYSIEFSVLLPLAAFTLIAGLPERRWRLVSGLTTVLLVMLGTFHTLYLPEEHRDPEHGQHDRLRFWSVGHFTPELDKPTVNEAIGRIPEEAPVSTLNNLVPHLTTREHVYMFPLLANAEYVLLVRDAYPWPMGMEEYAGRIEGLLASPEWDLVFERNGTLLFSRRQGAGS